MLWGDGFDDALFPFTIGQALAMFTRLRDRWHVGLKIYRRALASGASNGHYAQQAAQELGTAEMIALHSRAMVNILCFDRWRRGVMKERSLEAPCTLPIDERARGLMVAQLGVMQEALPLVQRDARLGYHQEARAYFYNSDRLQRSIDQMTRELDQTVPR